MQGSNSGVLVSSLVMNAKFYNHMREITNNDDELDNTITEINSHPFKITHSQSLKEEDRG